MAPPDPRCTIVTKIEANAVLITSLSECLRRYGSKKKTKILVGAVLEGEIGPNTNTPGRCKTFVIAKFGPSGGDMKVVTINIRIIKIHTPEPLCLVTDGDGG